MIVYKTFDLIAFCDIIVLSPSLNFVIITLFFNGYNIFTHVIVFINVLLFIRKFYAIEVCFLKFFFYQFGSI